MSESESICADDVIIRKTADFFRVLGDKTRVRIIAALDRRELNVCTLADTLCMTKSAVSHQLATLREAGFVKHRRDGKAVYYSLADSHIQTILESGMEHMRE